jgi:hypothetical protein
MRMALTDDGEGDSIHGPFCRLCWSPAKGPCQRRWLTRTAGAWYSTRSSSSASTRLDAERCEHRGGEAFAFEFLGRLSVVVGAQRLSGRYKVQGSRVEGSHFLAMAIAAAVASAPPVLRLVVDFSELDYKAAIPS